jgi:CarD family transcriptional regulator
MAKAKTTQKKATTKTAAKKKPTIIAAKKKPASATKKAVTKKAVAKKAVKAVQAKPASKLGTKKVSVSKGKGVSAKAVVKRVSLAPKLAAPLNVPTVDRRASTVTQMKKTMPTRPKLVADHRAAALKAKFATNAASKDAAKGFAINQYVVYPTHGVGKITALEVEKIGEHELRVFVINFEKDKMTLRVPVGRSEAAGLRSISPMDQISRALTTLKGRAKIARGMWSRRAQEYESKINSGNIIAIAEVVRDLHKNVDQSERSYSERMIYETALHRLVGEVAAAEKGDVQTTQERLLKVLRKQAA